MDKPFVATRGRLYKGEAPSRLRRLPFLSLRRRNRRKKDPARLAPWANAATTLWRVLPKAARLCGEILLVATVTYGLLWAGHRIVVSPRLALQHIEVHGLDQSDTEPHLTVAQICKLSQLTLGAPLLLLPIQEVARRIRAHPWVAQVTVWRALPGTLHLKVSLQQAAVLVSLDGIYLANAKGEVFKSFAAQDGVNLPVVTGLSRQQALQDPHALQEYLTQAISLLHASAAHPMELGTLDELHFDSSLGWSMMVRSVVRADGPVMVHLGNDALGRLPVAREALRYLIESGQKPAVIWADAKKNQGRVQVQLVGAAA